MTLDIFVLPEQDAARFCVFPGSKVRASQLVIWLRRRYTGLVRDLLGVDLIDRTRMIRTARDPIQSFFDGYSASVNRLIAQTFEDLTMGGPAFLVVP